MTFKVGDWVRRKADAPTNVSWTFGQEAVKVTLAGISHVYVDGSPYGWMSEYLEPAYLPIGTRVVLVEDHRAFARCAKGMRGEVVRDFSQDSEAREGDGGYKVKFDNGETWWVNASAVAPDTAPVYMRTPDGTVAAVEETTPGGAIKVAGVYYDPARLTAAEAPKPLPEVPADADTMLRMVDVFLARGDQQARDLQAVLSALRGPDSRDAKSSTTIPIRRAALPETAKVADSWGHAVRMDFEAKPYAAPSIDTHFGHHILMAASALRRMGREVK